MVGESLATKVYDTDDDMNSNVWLMSVIHSATTTEPLSVVYYNPPHASLTSFNADRLQFPHTAKQRQYLTIEAKYQFITGPNRNA